MSRPIRTSVAFFSLTLLVSASFMGGQHLRHLTAGPIELTNRISSLPETGFTTGAAVRTQDPDGNPDDTFREVLQNVNREYVDKIDDDHKLGFGAVKTMLASLDDPKTRFLDPKQRKQLVDSLNGQFPGIGATVQVVKQKRPGGDPKNPIDQRRLAIVAPVPGGPADKAGLRPGDIITEINGHWVIAYNPLIDLEGIRQENGSDDKQVKKLVKEAAERINQGVSLTKALEQLSANAGTALNLTVERPGQPAPIKVTLTTAVTTIAPVEYKELNSHAGYLRVTQFSDRATEQFTAALNGAKARDLIVDLRDNAGGPVTNRTNGALGSALALLAKLTPGGQVATVLRKGNKQEPIAVAAGAPARYRIAVLVNGGTANLAEMAAAALKERANATLVGEHTFGDAVYQRLVDLREGAGMTVTAGKFLTARGVDFSGKGLQPDVALATGGPKPADPAVERALASLAA